MTADARSSTKSRIPRLREGQRLTRSEFMRRWEAMPELKHAERIEGVVQLVTPPISAWEHGNPQLLIGSVLLEYSRLTPGTFAFSDSTIQIDGDNDLQPDLGLIVEPSSGGQTRRVGTLLAGAPELVVEIAASTTKQDLGRKLSVYRRAGVKEYLVWRTRQKEIDCFVNREGQFEATKFDQNILKSEVFPGLWIDINALVAGLLEKVHATLAAGLADPSHAKFKRKLAKARKR
jgi:Uma2 family endonuclease